MQDVESARMRALHELGLLNSAPSESFDRITRMASQIFDAPIAAVSLTDMDRQWFKSRVGCGTEIPRDKAPCAEVTRIGDVLVVSDLAQDIRFQGGILDREGVRFYAGAPLTTRDGFTLGAMCVLDTKPRTISVEQAKVLSDLAAMVMSQIELQHSFGRIDPSSGMPNRNQFVEDFEDLARDHAGEARVAMLVDIMGPSELNKTLRILGPSHIDSMVKAAADTLSSRLAGVAKLYQVGATQFATILKDTSTKLLCADITAYFTQKAEQSPGYRAGTLPAIGLMPIRLGEMSATQVLRSVHGAAQDARDDEQLIRVYSAASDDAHHRQYDLMNALPEAMRSDDQLALHFQPKVDMRTGLCVSAEALLRWNHPTLGNVPPGEFIPLAEVTELARPLTDWVIDTALRQVATWHDAGLDVKVSVNVSPSNLEEAGFAERMAAALLRHGVLPSMLEIEFTESGLIRDKARILESLAAIRALGVTCAIDDFGTGYSSFSYLKEIPAEIIKIDQSFIRDLKPGGPDSAVLRGMIGMCQNLGLKVVAEGVETEEAFDLLREVGCDEAQGYLISRPVPADAFAAWMRLRNLDASDSVAA